jgi:hypothetical protein
MTHTRTTSSRRSGVARSLVIVRAIGIVGSIGLLASCGSSSKKASSDRVSENLPTASTVAAAAQATTTAAPATTVAPKAADGVGNGDSQNRPATVLPVDRKRIVTVGVDVEVQEVSTAAIRVEVLAEGVGGFVNSQQTSLGENPTATLVVKIPPEKLSSFLESVNGLGKVLGRTQQSEDVTAQYTDLESRIVAARASVIRVRELVSKAGSVAELAQVEGELTRRETELEQLLGQQRLLDSKSEYATVTVAVRPVLVPVATTVASATTIAPKEKLPGQTTVLKRSTKGLIGALYVAWILFLALLPWVIVGAVVLGPLWMMMRRRRRASAKVYAAARLAASDPVVAPAAQNLPEPVVQRTDSTV